MFNIKDLVEHRKGGLYEITALPDEKRRLESCDEPFYEYLNTESGMGWARARSEMEDGRFKLVF